MNFLVICAGVPSEWYDQIYKNRSKIAGSNGLFVGAPLRPAQNGGYRYEVSYVNKLLKRAREHFLEADEARLRDTGIILCYLDHGSNTEGNLNSRFFPFALSKLVASHYVPSQPKKRREQEKNKLIAQLTSDVRKLKKAVGPIKSELQSSANQTPLLLPHRNFQSQHLLECLDGLLCEIVGANDPVAKIEEHVQTFKRFHRMERIGDAVRKCFVNQKNVAFSSPGSATHGFARPNYRKPHQITCLLNGRTRLGAPYHWSFHYDCVKVRANRARRLSGQFMNCHNEKKSYHGDPHLNIAPNDFVRT